MESNKVHAPKSSGLESNLHGEQEESSEMGGPMMAPPPFQLFAGGPPPEDEPGDNRFSHNPGKLDHSLESGKPFQMQRAAPAFSLSAGPHGPLENHPPNGLPVQLKAAMEQESGMDLSDVQVHRNSAQPAGMSALATAQGSQIHLGPGQEKHLPHEAWHVVQQKQGRVQPTVRQKSASGDGIAINDDPGLEKEADEMGAALQRKAIGMGQEALGEMKEGKTASDPAGAVVQRVAVQINPGAVHDLEEDSKEKESKEEKPREKGAKAEETILPNDSMEVEKDSQKDEMEMEGSVTEMPAVKEKREIRGNTVENILLVGRPSMAFGNTMGDHTSAYATHVAALKTRLRGKTFKEAFLEVAAMVAETEQLPGLQLLSRESGSEKPEGKESKQEMEPEQEATTSVKSGESSAPDVGKEAEFSLAAGKMRMKMNDALGNLKELRQVLASMEGTEGRFALLLQDFIGAYLEFREVVPLSVINIRSKSPALAGKGKGEAKMVKALQNAELKMGKEGEKTLGTADSGKKGVDLELQESIFGAFDLSGASLAAMEMEEWQAEEMVPGLGKLAIKKRIEVLASQHIKTVQMNFPQAFKAAFPDEKTAVSALESKIVTAGTQHLFVGVDQVANDILVANMKIGNLNVEATSCKFTNSNVYRTPKTKPILILIGNELDTIASKLNLITIGESILKDYGLNDNRISMVRTNMETQVQERRQAVGNLQVVFKLQEDNDWLRKWKEKYGIPAAHIEIPNDTEANQPRRSSRKSNPVNKIEKKVPPVKDTPKKRKSAPESEEKLRSEAKEPEKNSNDSNSREPEKTDEQLLLQEEKKQSLAVQLSLDSRDKIVRVEMAGRTPSPFSGTMGAHTTAWVVHVDRIRNALVGKEFFAGFKKMTSLVEEARQMYQDVLTQTDKRYRPKSGDHQDELCEEALKSLDNFPLQDESQVTAQNLFTFQSWISALLTFINYIPFSTLDSTDTNGRGEGKSRNDLLDFENQKEGREAIESSVLREAIYNLFDVSEESISPRSRKEDEDENAQAEIIKFLIQRHLNLVAKVYPKAYKKANPSAKGLQSFLASRGEEKSSKSKTKNTKSLKTETKTKANGGKEGEFLDEKTEAMSQETSFAPVDLSDFKTPKEDSGEKK